MSREDAAKGRYRVGVDIGGTFTDIVMVAPDGSITTLKVLSTPDDYSLAVVNGIGRLLTTLDLDPRNVEELVHGTTIATNAILEKRGARTALITTAGFRDVLEIRRVRMPQLYNIQWEKPAPLVPRFLRFEVAERIDATGAVLSELDDGRVESLVDRLRRASIESVAVCLINSYLNPVHEQRLANLLRRSLPNVSISISSDITREIKEFERTSTTVIDAYVKPVVDRYLRALETGLQSAGVNCRLLVMQSNGAVMSIDAAREHPCFLIESGPAAGAIAGSAVAQRIAESNVITFDMGGTTAKAAMVEHGQVGLTDEYEVGSGITVGTRLMKGDGYLLRIPAVDLAEVGAGGGSIAWVDAGGRLQIGPQSAGALPGPACYGLGGVEPTITDANVVLGYIDPDQFAGTSVRIDRRLAWKAMAHLASKLDVGPEEAALAVHVVANARMSRPIRAVTVERGLDVRDFTLLAFGGSGPIHAARLAGELRIQRLVIPPHAGVFSAVGLTVAHAGHHVVRTLRRRVDQFNTSEFWNAIVDLRRAVNDQLQRLNYPSGERSFVVSADMRYVGQAFSLTVDLTEMLDESDQPLESAAEMFASSHERTYGHRAEADPIEIVSLRLQALIGTGTHPHARQALERSSAHPLRMRKMLFQRDVGVVDVPVIARPDLSNPREGPLAIEEPDTTIIVPPGCRAQLDEWNNVRIDIERIDA